MIQVDFTTCGVSLEVEADSQDFGQTVLDRFCGRPATFVETMTTTAKLPVAIMGGVATIDHQGLRGEIDLRRGRIRTPPSMLVADALVRAAVAWRLAERGGLLLHASAFRHGAGAVVAFGKSGVGKTTTARELGAALSDEFVVLRQGDSGWIAEGTPWWHGSGESAPLLRLLWLVRGESPSLRPAVPGELLRALVAQAGRFFPEADFQARLFALCADLARCGATRIAAAEGRVVPAVRDALAVPP